jgi:hypothetical protein
MSTDIDGHVAGPQDLAESRDVGCRDLFGRLARVKPTSQPDITIIRQRARDHLVPVLPWRARSHAKRAAEILQLHRRSSIRSDGRRSGAD